MKQVFPRDSANILLALCTLFMYSCTVASHSTGAQGTTTTKVYVHDTTRIISTIVAHDNDTLILHDTTRLIVRDTVWKGDYVMYDTIIKHDTIVKPYAVLIHDTIIKPPVHDTLKIKVPIHDTIIKTIRDTIIIHDSSTVIKKDSSSKTLYLRDLGIVPNTGECLTDKLINAVDRAATGGKTTLVFSDEGVYNISYDFLTIIKGVTIKYDCYPNDIKNIGVISIKPCK